MHVETTTRYVSIMGRKFTTLAGCLTDEDRIRSRIKSEQKEIAYYRKWYFDGEYDEVIGRHLACIADLEAKWAKVQEQRASALHGLA